MNEYVLQRISVHMWSLGICGVYGQEARYLYTTGLIYPAYSRLPSAASKGAKYHCERKCESKNPIVEGIRPLFQSLVGWKYAQ